MGMPMPPGILKHKSHTIVPIHQHLISAGEGKSVSISFIGGPLPLVTGRMGKGLKDILDDPRVAKLSEQEIDKDLEELSSKNSVHIRQIPQDNEKYINVPNKYQVLNTEGERLYDVVETTDAITRRLFRKDQPFSMRVINVQAEYICELVGDPGVSGLGAFVKLKKESKVLGTIVQTNPLFACCNFSPSYTVYDETGKLTSKIVWQGGRLKSCMFTENFQVYSTIKKNLMGNVSRLAQSDCLDEFSQADSYALSFYDKEMDNLHKMYLIAAIVMLDFQFFEGREGNNLFKIAVCLSLVIWIGLCVGGIAIYLFPVKAK